MRMGLCSIRILVSIPDTRGMYSQVYVIMHAKDSNSDSDSEIIYSATYLTIKVFTYITFQYNGPSRPPLRQNYVAGLGATQMRYLYVHVYIIFCIYMHIYIIIHNNIPLARNKYIT